MKTKYGEGKNNQFMDILIKKNTPVSCSCDTATSKMYRKITDDNIVNALLVSVINGMAEKKREESKSTYI